MAKKTASKKKTTRKKAPAKKTAKKSAPKSPRAAKKTTKKPAAKKTTAKKAAGKKTAKKPAAKKSAAKKSAAKKTTAKKAASKKSPKKNASPKPAPSKPSSKKTASKASTSKPSAGDGAKQDASKKDADGKPARKGITIVNDRPARRPRAKKPPAPTAPPPGPRLLGPNSPVRKPLIPSGKRDDTKADAGTANDTGRKKKSPFNKRQLDKYKDILIAKRRELIGDVEQMETDALRSSSGGLSHTPQHIAEQGSDSADQSLNLNLAAADRRLIKEIDDALARIADKTYGLCELTGEPINPERLEELPWARHSIKAAQQLERFGGHR